MPSAKCEFIAQAPASWSSRLIALLHKVYFFTVALSSTSVLLVALGIGLHALSQTEAPTAAWVPTLYFIDACATPLVYSATLIATTVWLWQDLNTITESHLLRYVAFRSTMSVLIRNSIFDSALLYPFGANVASDAIYRLALNTVSVEVIVALIVCLSIPYYKPEHEPNVEPLDEVISS